MQQGHILKKLNYDLIRSLGSGSARGLQEKYLLPCCFISWFPWTAYATWPCSVKGSMWPIDRIPRVRGVGRLGGLGRGSLGKIFATLLLHLWFSLIWYATWPCSDKVEFWPFDPTPQVHSVGESQALDRKSLLICFIFIVPLSACEISVKILTNYWVIAKVNYLTFDPI